MKITLLLKYLSDECRADEKKRVKEWLIANPENREYMKSLKKIWDVEPKDEMNVNSREAWNSFRKRIIEKSKTKSNETAVIDLRPMLMKKTRQHQRKRTNDKSPLVYAVATAAVVLIAFLFYQFGPKGNTNPDKQPQMQELLTEKDQRATFRLSDGTYVKINADSKLKIPPTFTEATRKIYLQGEAYFEVARDAEHPFIVKSRGSTVEVLGTKFNVKADTSADNVQVAVLEGKVELKSTGTQNTTSAILTQNHLGVMRLSDSRITIEKANARNYLSWMNNRLAYSGETLAQVSRQLERLYKVDIVFAADQLKKLKLTADFEKNDLETTVATIANTFDIGYQMDDRKVKWME